MTLDVSWATYFRSVFIPAVDAFADSLTSRVLPAFKNIAEESDRIIDEEWKRLTESAAVNADPGDLADAAQNKGIAFYVTMTDMAQGVLNMFAAGLYHLFEQQALFFLRRELLEAGEETNAALFNILNLVKRLEIEGINIVEFASWPKIRELRLVANAVKHADGPACDELKKLHPDIFNPPIPGKSVNVPPELVAGFMIFQPLAGQDMFVSEEIFRQYASDVKLFWREFCDCLETRAIT